MASFTLANYLAPSQAATCISSNKISPVTSKQTCIAINRKVGFSISNRPLLQADVTLNRAPARARRGLISCSLAVEAKAPITFNIGETSVSLPFSVAAALALDASIGNLLQTFKEKEKAVRPQRWNSMEFRHNGNLEEGEAFLEAFCNPNAYSNAFQAKVLITVKDDRLKFTSEGPLSAIKADVDQYLAAHQ